MKFSYNDDNKKNDVPIINNDALSSNLYQPNYDNKIKSDIPLNKLFEIACIIPWIGLN